MPVQKFAPMTKDYATFDCDAHVTEPTVIWERAHEYLTKDELEALKATIIGNIFGAVCALVAALLIVNVDIGAITAPVWVGVMVFVLVYASQVEALANIPGAVVGFAATFAYMLEANALNDMSVTAISFDNPLVIVSVSLAIGAVFGGLSSRLAGMLGGDD